ncbi:phosphoribosyltransferase family protein [Gordonia amarae]|uniref:phosphoribosyltransferase family protein n=1 Tax=Gordonia amarae TaxID=36821 RepID=UPI001AF11823|nr:phosphoribosyltransferase family protein [Gordonia amarae]QHN15723.1 phosphoribosyltransferase [Gordonia amarae]QHN20292.1 phosphoribosyltransferase [Gordonia amarae]
MSAPTGTGTGWVSERFGVRLDGDGVTELVRLGLRRNSKRAHLLVSTVLGKHIPTDPVRVRGAADRLADLVVELIGAEKSAAATVLGFAETATGLGHCVADRMGAACYLHSTRRRADGVSVTATFEEGHSHATTHLIEPTDDALFAPDSPDTDVPLVLVDDEISTGATALEAIAALHAQYPRRSYVAAALVDMRDAAQQQQCEAEADRLGLSVTFVALAHGSIGLPSGFTEQVCALAAPELNPVGPVPGSVTIVRAPWPTGVPDGGRHGFLRADTASFEEATAAVTAAVRERLDPAVAVVVVGHEEFMYQPLCVAEHLAQDGFTVRYQTSTRSPAFVLDEPGYPLRRGFEFPAPEGDTTAKRYLYNAVLDPTDPAGSQVVFVCDEPAGTDDLYRAGGLVDVLTRAGHNVVVAVVDTPSQQSLRTAREAR